MQWTHPSTGRQCAFGSAEKGPSAEVSAVKPMSTARAELITCRVGKMPYEEGGEGGVGKREGARDLSAMASLRALHTSVITSPTA